MKAIERLYDFLEQKGVKPTVFERSAGISSGYLSKQYARKADIGESILVQITENCPEMNPAWLLTGCGPMLKEEPKQIEAVQAAPVHLSNDEFIRIPVVDISVAAGSGYANPDYIDEVECISMPRSMVRNGRTYLCVRVKGQSMIPSIMDGGYLIVCLLDRSEWDSIRDNYVYVVSDIEGKAYVKRLKNRLRQHGFVVCMSDNVEKQHYPNFNIYEEELNTIWYAEWYFSAKIPNIQETYYRKQAELEDQVDELRMQFQQFQKALKMNN